MTIMCILLYYIACLALLTSDSINSQYKDDNKTKLNNQNIRTASQTELDQIEKDGKSKEGDGAEIAKKTASKDKNATKTDVLKAVSLKNGILKLSGLKSDEKKFYIFSITDSKEYTGSVCSDLEIKASDVKFIKDGHVEITLPSVEDFQSKDIKEACIKVVNSKNEERLSRPSFKIEKDGLALNTKANEKGGDSNGSKWIIFGVVAVVLVLIIGGYVFYKCYQD